MIVADSFSCLTTSMIVRRESTVINYHAPFDRGFTLKDGIYLLCMVLVQNEKNDEKKNNNKY